MAKKSVKKETSKSVDPTTQLTQFLKDRKGDHYNFEDTVYYEVSHGSLLLDIAISKLDPQCCRFVGCGRSGKTSHMLNCVKNFLDTVDNSRALWVIAEGRLSKELKERSGLKFTHNPEEWEDGSVFVFESQVYETVFDLIRELMKNNPEKKRYFFVIDSTNGLKRKEDIEKATSQAEKVAGGALLTSDFLSRVSLGMAKFGHICGMISQVRTNIKINPYEKSTPQLSMASGGAAADHYPTTYLSFNPKYKSDLIGDANNPQGHWVTVDVIKTNKEKTSRVKYPIKYDSDDKGGSIWVEYEIADLMIQWGFFTKSASWMKMNEEYVKELKENELIDQDEITLQGLDKIREWLEENPKITKFLYDKFQKLLA